MLILHCRMRKPCLLKNDYLYLSIVRKAFIISTVFTAVLFPLIIMAQQNLPAYRKTGPAYIVSDAGGAQSVLSIAEYKNAAANSWHYILRLNDVKDNSELRRKEIAVTHDKPIEHERLIGKPGNVFLVVTDSFVGYDEHTLEPVITESTIIEANPFMKDNISRQHYSYLPDEATAVLYLRDEKGDSYKLYPGSPVLKPDDGNNEQAPEDYSYEFAADYKLYDRYKLISALTCIDTAGNSLYILGSEKETASVVSYFGTAIFPEREESRQLTIVPFPPGGEKAGYKNNPPKTGKASYYKGAFLQNKFSTTAWKNKQGDRIILFQTNTIRPMLRVALVDREGKEKWRTDAGMETNRFIDYLVAENNLLLWFNIPGSKDNSFKTSVVNIDLLTGNLIGGDTGKGW